MKKQKKKIARGEKRKWNTDEFTSCKHATTLTTYNVHVVFEEVSMIGERQRHWLLGQEVECMIVIVELGVVPQVVHREVLGQVARWKTQLGSFRERERERTEREIAFEKAQASEFNGVQRE
jgi:hypothetical protein